jgi:hypothetical protein
MGFFRWFGVVAFALLLVWPRDARAADGDYRSTLIGCDVAAVVPPAVNVTLAAVVWATHDARDGRSSTLQSLQGALPYTAGIGAGTFVLCSPVVHAAHGRPQSALGSLAVRVGFPLAGAGLTYLTWREVGFESGAGAVTTIFTTAAAVPAGIALALVMDYKYFAEVRPRVAPLPGGAAAGIEMVF